MQNCSTCRYRECSVSKFPCKDCTSTNKYTYWAKKMEKLDFDTVNALKDKWLNVNGKKMLCVFDCRCLPEYEKCYEAFICVGTNGEGYAAESKEIKGIWEEPKPKKKIAQFMFKDAGGNYFVEHNCVTKEEAETYYEVTGFELIKWPVGEVFEVDA